VLALLKLFFLPICLPRKIVSELIGRSGHSHRYAGRSVPTQHGRLLVVPILVMLGGLGALASGCGSAGSSPPANPAPSEAAATTQPAPPADTSSPPPVHHRRPSRPLSCSASVANRHPADYTTDYVQVTTASFANVTTVAQYRTTSTQHTAQADASGQASIAYYISGATPGYQVNVDVTVSRGDRHGSCSTWFTPPKPPAQPQPSGASCSATASVYSAYYDENNVYVNSNQPYTEATASADGYSWSYETNGNGYALIYLNGPPPGAQITVTVGGATCYTSD
jgi:hypothetical protein